MFISDGADMMSVSRSDWPGGRVPSYLHEFHISLMDHQPHTGDPAGISDLVHAAALTAILPHCSHFLSCIETVTTVIANVYYFIFYCSLIKRKSAQF